MLRRRLWFFAVVSLSLLIAAGGTPLWGQPSSQNKAEDQARTQLQQAKALLQAGKPLPAVEALQTLIAAFPVSASVPEAYLLLGQTLSGLRKTDESNTYYRRLLEEYPASEFAPQARLGLASGLIAVGQQDAAIPLLIEAKEQTPDPIAKLTILRQLEEIFLSKHDTLRAVEYSVEAHGLAAEDVRPQIEDRIRNHVHSTASEQDLRRIAERFPQGFPGDLALLRLLEVYGASGEDHKVRRVARDFLTRFPKHELAGTATDTLTALRKKLKAKGTLIGALLPLSGSMSPYGNDVLHGIKIALDQAAEATPPLAVGLVAKDTESDPKRLMLELDDLLADYRPVAVIGPLLTREVKTVAHAADASEVVFITPTATLTEVQRLSRYFFNTAVNNRGLVRELALHVTGPLGWKRFCILAPRDAYGSEMTQMFTEEVRRLGGEIIATDSYGPEDNDFGPPIKRIMAEDLKRHGKLEPGTKRGKNIKVYVPGFDAIFLPGEAARVGLVAGQVTFYGAKVGLLGTNGMNSQDLIRVGGRSVEDAIFADSFSVDSLDPSVRDFVGRYVKRFQEPPTAFAAQAYEATRLALDAIRRGATTGRALRESLKSVKNLPGLAGPLTMSPAGHLERLYGIIQVKNGKFVPVPVVSMSETR
jgi:ABC-type branched-subunit amino acid transport system substrate-binding protein/predicted negative regulator of RcsB-dependent stress response